MNNKIAQASTIVTGIAAFAAIIVSAFSPTRPVPEEYRPSSPELKIPMRALEDAGYVVLGQYSAEPSAFAKTTACLPESSDEDDGLSLRYLVLSISAIEQYNRPESIRALEFFLARAALRLFGATPDFSLGIAQVSISNARKLLQDTQPGNLSDLDLVNILEDPCENLALAARFLSNVLEDKTHLTLREQMRAVSLAYNGAREPLSVITFRKAVVASYNILGEDYIWNTYEYDVRRDAPAVIYGARVEELHNRIDGIQYDTIAEGVSKKSNRHTVTVVSYFSPEVAGTRELAISTSRSIRGRLIENGVVNKIETAISVYPQSDREGSYGPIGRIYVGGDPGIVEFVQSSNDS